MKPSCLRFTPRLLAFWISRRRASLLHAFQLRPIPGQERFKSVPQNKLGIRLRDAMPVRAAEHWLQLGESDLALRELESLVARNKPLSPVTCESLFCKISEYD